MTKFLLYQVYAGERDKKPIRVRGFAEAEVKAKELLAALLPNYPDYHDTYIECWEDGGYLDIPFNLLGDRLIMAQDYFGDVYWRMMIYRGDTIPLCSKLLTDDQKEILEEWRNEKEVDITDLSKQELIELRSQICVGSIYLSDYENELGVNEEQVCDACEGYDNWLYEDGWKDNGEAFAYYIMNFY